MHYNIPFILIIIYIISFFFYLIYFLFTKKQKIIYVTKKFSVKVSDKKTYKIFDDQKIEYIFNENLLISQKRSKDIWEKNRENQQCEIVFYSINLPILNIHYKVIDVL